MALPRTPGRAGAYTSSKYGNVITLEGRSTDPQAAPISLLKVNLSEVGGDFLKAGAWVLTVQSSELSTGSPEPMLGVGRVRMGSGGAGSEFEISLFPGCSIQVPSDEIELSAFVARNSGFAWSMKVAAYVKPGFSSSPAKRIFRCGMETPSGGVLVNIPAYARDVMIYAQQGSSSGYYGLAAALELWAGNQRCHVYSGAEVLAILNDGGRIPIPGGCNAWALPAGADIFLTGLNADFSIQL